jgi:hypothetical protein
MPAHSHADLDSDEDPHSNTDPHANTNPNSDAHTHLDPIGPNQHPNSNQHPRPGHRHSYSNGDPCRLSDTYSFTNRQPYIDTQRAGSGVFSDGQSFSHSNP